MNGVNQEFSVIGFGKTIENRRANQAQQGGWLKSLYHPKALKLLDARSIAVMQAAYDAVLESGMNFTTASPRRGISLSVDSPNFEQEDFRYAFTQNNRATVIKQLAEHLNPLWLLSQLPNIPASHLAIQYKCQGPVFTCSGGEGQQAIEAALDTLENDEADTMFVGSCAEQSWMFLITTLENTLALKLPTQLNFTRQTLSVLLLKKDETL